MNGHLYELGRFDVPGVATDRRVRVYLPARKPKRPAPRPLLVMFDGQNVFGDHGSFAGGWHTHVAVDRYAARRARPPIVVAIDHGHARRIDELTPFREGRRGANADALLHWVATSLVPCLRAEFDVVQTPLDTVLAGSSLGGLAALYGHLRYPGVFGGAIVMSPSFWLIQARIVELVAHQPVPALSKIYLDAGHSERRIAPLVEEVARRLRARGYGSDRLRVRHDPRGKHDERSWRRRLPGALRFTFG